MAGQVRQAGSYRDRNSTADRALDILLMFNDDQLTLSAVEVNERLGVARSTAYRYLQSLTQSGFLEGSESGYRLGRRVMELARLARRGLGLSDVARTAMRALADEVRETVLLTKLAGASVICLEREEVSDRVVRISYERGQVLPANAGAAAHVLLAWLPDDQVTSIVEAAPLPRFTDTTVTSLRELRERLRDTAARGYAISRAELDPDVLGIAAPVRDDDGRVTAAISVAAVASRIPDDRVPAIVDAVRAAATTVSAELALLR
jgi:DNA-binding IclR family transcriptional regulator